MLEDTDDEGDGDELIDDETDADIDELGEGLEEGLLDIEADIEDEGLTLALGLDEMLGLS